MSRPAIDVAPHAPADPFALLGIARTYRVDAAALRSAHLRLAAAIHPDRVTAPVETLEASRRAAELNDAYRTLNDPTRRAEAILALENVPTPPAGTETLPGEFLMEMMELRESLDDAIVAGDAARIAELRDDGFTRRAESLESLGGLFDRALVAVGPERLRLLDAARQELSVLRYIVRLLDRVAAHAASED